MPTLAFLPKGVSFRLIATLPPSTGRPAVLPVLEPPPAGRLPPEPGAASFGACTAGRFPGMRAVPARASALVIDEPRRSRVLDDERAAGVASLWGLPPGST